VRPCPSMTGTAAVSAVRRHAYHRADVGPPRQERGDADLHAGGVVPEGIGTRQGRARRDKGRPLMRDEQPQHPQAHEDMKHQKAGNTGDAARPPQQHPVDEDATQKVSSRARY